MKTFNTLKWTGYIILAVPSLLIIAAVYVSISKDDSDKSIFIKGDKNDKSVVYDTIKVYDTVHIKVYDTIKIQEKPKQATIQQINTPTADTIK